MAAVVLPRSLRSHLRSRVDGSPACTTPSTRVRVQATCVGTAGAKKRCRREEPPPMSPPTKRRRGQDGSGAAPEKKMASFEEREGVTDGVLSLVVPGSGLLPLPAPVVGFLLQNQTGDGAGEEVEIDVYALGDDDLFALKKHVEECLQEKERSKNSQSPPSEPTARPEPTDSHLSRAACLKTRYADIIAKSCRFLGRTGGEEPHMAMERKVAARLSAEEAKARRKMEIQRQREEARRVLDEMVRTVEFNDPNICPEDVLS